MQRKNDLSLLLRVEMILATFIPLILNILWAPVMDTVTHGKYGTSNQLIFLVLSFCIPFQYMNNFFWTAHFAQRRLATVFRIILITCLIVMIGDFIFIPLYSIQGAACVYLVAIIVEYVNYMRSSSLSAVKETWRSLIVCTAMAVVCGLFAYYFFNSILFRLLFATISFFTLLVAFRQLKKTDLYYLVSLRSSQKAGSIKSKSTSPRYENETTVIS
jgi:O-antigen/teichoic acid export membrane protein